MLKEISLRPYPAQLFYAKTKTDYEKGHQKLFGIPAKTTPRQQGQFSARSGPEQSWVCLIWAEDFPSLAHEVSHVVLTVFEDIGVDPIESSNEPFCYLLEQILRDILKWITLETISAASEKKKAGPS